MALIKTIAEIKAVLRISNLDEDTSIPDVESAEESYIIPAIGKSLYNSLSDAYNATTPNLTDDQKKLLKKIQKPLAAAAFYDELAVVHARITDAGVRRTTTDNMPAAFRWEFDGVKDFLANRYYQGMESLLEFLEENKTTFLWADSDAYKRRQRFLIKTALDFNDQYTLHQPYRTYSSLLSVMGDVETMYIESTIGKTFFDALKSAADPSVYDKILIADLKKAIAHFCIKHAAEKLPVQVSDTGFTVITSFGADQTGNAGKDKAPDNLLNMVMQACDRDGQNYLTRAKSYLNLVASDVIFPIYKASTYYTSPAVIETNRDEPNNRRKIFTL